MTESRALWSEKEVLFLIKTIKANNIMEALDRKRYRNAGIYKSLVPMFAIEGYSRSIDQIRNKWKMLQSDYRKARITNSKSGAGTKRCPFYDELHAILGGRPNVRLIATKVESEGATAKDDAQLPFSHFNVDVASIAPAFCEVVESVEVEDISSNTTSTSKSSSPTPKSSSRVARKRKISFTHSMEKIAEQLSNTEDAIRDATERLVTAMSAEFVKQRAWEAKQSKKGHKAQAQMMAFMCNAFGKIAKGLKVSKDAFVLIDSSSDSD